MFFLAHGEVVNGCNRRDAVGDATAVAAIIRRFCNDRAVGRRDTRLPSGRRDAVSFER